MRDPAPDASSTASGDGIVAARARTLVGLLRVRAAIAVEGVIQHTVEQPGLIQEMDVQTVRLGYGA